LLVGNSNGETVDELLPDVDGVAVDVEALDEFSEDWGVEEGTESGFSGTLAKGSLAVVVDDGTGVVTSEVFTSVWDLGVGIGGISNDWAKVWREWGRRFWRRWTVSAEANVHRVRNGAAGVLARGRYL
jgi:hypothetical protein